MAALSDQVDPKLEAHTELVNWVIQHGGAVSKTVRISQDASRGVHLQVKADLPSAIPKETKVINTPISVSMSWYNAVGYESPHGSFPKYGVDFPRSWIDQIGPEETSAFFLMGQYLRGEEGFWYPYLRTLPQPGQLTTPLFFGEEDVDWIQGTGIPEASVERIRIWERKFDEAITLLEESGFLDCERFTWELYLWASTIITSRAFSAKVLSGAVQPDDLPEDGISVLLPLIDLPNHRPMAKVEWRAGDEDIGLIVLEDVAPGEEVSNNYGPRNNEQLFMNYGFCIAGNPTDYRIVHLGVKPDSPLGQAKARQLELFPQAAKNVEEHYYIFNPYYPFMAPETPMEHSIFSPALFNALTVMESNVRERKMLEITEDTIRIIPGYGNNHSIYAALAQISFELIAHSTNLKASAEDLPEPTNLNHIHSQIYRNGQILIDESALIIASWCIARGREHKRGESWEDTKALLHELMERFPAGLLPDDVLSRIRVRILERPSLITKNGELYRLGELFSLLPAEMQQPSQTCFQHILGEASQNVPPMASDPQSLFATVICLLIATYNSPEARSRLPSRLSCWVAFLLEQYPLPSDAEGVSEPLELFQEYAKAVNPASWAAGDGVDWLAEDSGWLDAKWLHWAWIVAGEEMVMIPLDPFDILKMEGSLSMLKQACLYVPQE
ncbi:uncharacterized protein N7515_003669 [Penicillium bovifimosum]|uniref:SET domain-containing protein n=1 Tax=Penicillium bovifimosum TaxID=126998 RepID=A0A9W9H5I5_9EURO|nr:uncharacterized protein N7515_003669 [Penicillium bovifimosum]KAJ5138821.1 hypothetical protein N7515_003669 [Penicillium bovifimosum]